MHKIIAAAILSLGLAAPALAYSTRQVEFDPAAELQRTTGSVQYPESSGGIVREGRIGRGGSEAYPQPTRGIAHDGTNMMTGGSSRFPVLTPDMLSHPATALDQNQALVDEFGADRPAPANMVGSMPGPMGGDAGADGGSNAGG